MYDAPATKSRSVPRAKRTTKVRNRPLRGRGAGGAGGAAGGGNSIREGAAASTGSTRGGAAPSPAVGGGVGGSAGSDAAVRGCTPCANGSAHRELDTANDRRACETSRQSWNRMGRTTKAPIGVRELQAIALRRRTARAAMLGPTSAIKRAQRR